MGSDEKSAYTSGVRIYLVRIGAHIIGGVYAALAAIAFTGLIGSGDPTQGTTYTLMAVTALVLGGSSLIGGRGGAFGAILGSVNIYLINFILSTFRFERFQSFVTDLSYGAVLVASLLILIALPYIQKAFKNLSVFVFFIIGTLSATAVLIHMKYDQVTRGTVGGFGGKSDLLATCQTYTGNPGCYQESAKYLDAATSSKIKATFAEWIDDTPYVLTILPSDQYGLSDESVDRSTGVPYPTEKVSFKFPTLQTATLSNGAKVVLAQRSDVPLVEMNFQFNFGYAQENNNELGFTNFMMDMLNEGTKKYSSLQFDEALDSLGSNLGFGSGLDTSVISLSSLKGNLADTLDLAKEALISPTFPQAEIDRIKSQTLASIVQEENRPASIAYRNIGKLLYGDTHPYGKPLTGSGLSDTISSITRTNIIDLHARALSPDNLTFAVAGDIDLESAELLVSVGRGIEKEEKYTKTASIRLGNTKAYDKDSLQITQSKRQEPRIPFGTLVEMGFLTPGQKLRSLNGRHVAKIRADGTLIAHDTRGSIHQVGAVLEGLPSCNGWTYWQYKKNGKNFPIDILRQKIRSQVAL